MTTSQPAAPPARDRASGTPRAPHGELRAGAVPFWAVATLAYAATAWATFTRDAEWFFAAVLVLVLIPPLATALVYLALRRRMTLVACVVRIGCCVAVLPLGWHSGHAARDLAFRYLWQARFEALVDRIKGGEFDVGFDATRLDAIEAEAAPSYAVIASRDEQGFVTVQFFYGHSFLAHAAYVYASSGLVLADAHWPAVTRIDKHWFYVHD